VAEPVLIGLGGIAIGALGSGSVQAYLARADRRRDGHHAARILYVQLHDAQAAIASVRQFRDWNRMITDWSAYGVAWAEYRDQVTHVLNTRRFATVDSAFACTTSLSRSREADLAEPLAPTGAPPNFGPPDPLLLLYFETVKRAKRIVLEASFRWWEIRARRKALAE
jgi:hypothetical protein